jgi:glutathione gamma-glutamylcysteinyltransferase
MTLAPSHSRYRQPLPSGHVPFASPEGRVLFEEAMRAGSLESFFPLIEQFHTQADPAFCGLASLVMTLNALAIDPGRLWRGPWRWFSEDLLDCCSPLEDVRKVGVSMAEVACLARCNGANATLTRATLDNETDLRTAIASSSTHAGEFVIASYCRSGLAQTGTGHFSPVGGYHAARDLVLLLDVARFKYPPHWVPLAALHAAMLDHDPIANAPRGWITLRRRDVPSSLAYVVSCKGGVSIGADLERLVHDTRIEIRQTKPNTLEALLKTAASVALASELPRLITLRSPLLPEHQTLFDSLEQALCNSDLYKSVSQSIGPQQAALVTTWLMSAPAETWAEVSNDLAQPWAQLLAADRLGALASTEVMHLRDQVRFLLDHAAEVRDP